MRILRYVAVDDCGRMVNPALVEGQIAGGIAQGLGGALKEELPPVQKLYQDFRGKGLEVLLIDFGEDLDLVRRTVKERGYIAPVRLDESGDVSGKVYHVWAPPTLCIVDRPGPTGRTRRWGQTLG